MKLINLGSPYNCNNNKNITSLIVQLKHLVNKINKEGFLNFTNTEIVPVRRSIYRNEWVIDYCSKKEEDIKGRSLIEQDRFLFEKLYSEEFIEFTKKINVINNEFKYLVFIKREEDYYFLGTFNIISSKHRDGININSRNYALELLDDNKEIKDKTNNILSFDNSKFEIKLKDKFDFNLFIKNLEKETLKLNISKIKTEFKVLENNTENRHCRITNEECISILSGKNISTKILNKNKFKIFGMYILNNFLIILNNNTDKFINDIVVKDNITNKFYIFRSIDFLNLEEEEDNFDYSLLIPSGL